MATTKISIGTVNAQIGVYNNAYGEIVNLMSKINSNYFDAMEGKWNTITAHKYFTSFVNAMNETIDKMNKGFSAASEEIQDAAHHIAEAEGGAQVKRASTPTIKSMSLTWQGKDDEYNISDDIDEMTKSNFTNAMTQVENKISECRKAMETIRNQGLSDYISSSAINSINNMISSAKNVANEYSKDAVQNAATQDANAKGYVMKQG